MRALTDLTEEEAWGVRRTLWQSPTDLWVQMEMVSLLIPCNMTAGQETMWITFDRCGAKCHSWARFLEVWDDEVIRHLPVVPWDFKADECS